MDLVAKLPAMEDAALTVLQSNALRLQQTGTSAQRTAAANLLPAIEAELTARRAAKQRQLSEARAAAAAAAPKRRAKSKGARAQDAP